MSCATYPLGAPQLPLAGAVEMGHGQHPRAVLLAIPAFFLTRSINDVGVGTHAQVVVAVSPDPTLRPPISGPLLERLAFKYSTYAVADSTLETAASSLGMSFSQLRPAVRVTTTPGTGNIVISARLADEASAVRVAGELSNLTVERSADDRLVQVTVISSRSEAGSSGDVGC